MSGEDEHLAWYVPRVLRMRLPGRSSHVIAPGWTYHSDNIQEMRERNFAVWESPLDALLNHRGMTICRVRLRGTIVRGKRDELFATELTVLWLGKWGRLLERFVCDLAEKALYDQRECGRIYDPRLDDLVARKRRAIENPHFRQAYTAAAFGDDWWKSFEQRRQALNSIPWSARGIVSHATHYYFIGGDCRGDHSARQNIKSGLAEARRYDANIGAEVAALLTETFGNTAVNP